MGLSERLGWHFDWDVCNLVRGQFFVENISPSGALRRCLISRITFDEA